MKYISAKKVNKQFFFIWKSIKSIESIVRHKIKKLLCQSILERDLHQNYWVFSQKNCIEFIFH